MSEKIESLYSEEFLKKIDSMCNASIETLNGIESEIFKEIEKVFNSQNKKVQRSRSNDKFFIPITHYLELCIWDKTCNRVNNLYNRVLDMFYSLMKYVVEPFESKNGEIHKGSPFYNIGLCEFLNGNLDAAMCYFEKAATEDRLLEGSETRKTFLGEGLFHERIFKRFKDECCELFNKEFKEVFNKELKSADVKELFEFLNIQNSLQLLFVLQRYFTVTCLEKNTSTSVIRMRILADMTHLLECNLAQKSVRGETLENLLNVINPRETRCAFKSRTDSKELYPRETISDLNFTITKILNEFEKAEEKVRGGIILYLSYIIRNHTNHRLDESFVLYNDVGLFNKAMALIFVSHIIAQYHQQDIRW